MAKTGAGASIEIFRRTEFFKKKEKAKLEDNLYKDQRSNVRLSAYSTIGEF